jgi:hypothetical protein
MLPDANDNVHLIDPTRGKNNPELNTPSPHPSHAHSLTRFKANIQQYLKSTQTIIISTINKFTPYKIPITIPDPPFSLQQESS